MVADPAGPTSSGGSRRSKKEKGCVPRGAPRVTKVGAAKICRNMMFPKKGRDESKTGIFEIFPAKAFCVVGGARGERVLQRKDRKWCGGNKSERIKNANLSCQENNIVKSCKFQTWKQGMLGVGDSALGGHRLGVFFIIFQIRLVSINRH